MGNEPDYNQILRWLTECNNEFSYHYPAPPELGECIKYARERIAQKLEAKAARIREGKELP